MIKKITVEALIIFLAAAAFGAAWNRQLLTDTYSGKTTQAAPATPAAVSPLPLPAGLLQVKDFFDRKEAVLVDARDTETYTGGRIQGAVSLPVGEFEQRLPDFLKMYKKDQPLVVYCNGYGCPDSMTVGEALIKAGYTTVFAYEGGYPEWKEAGHPVEGTNP